MVSHASNGCLCAIAAATLFACLASRATAQESPPRAPASNDTGGAGSFPSWLQAPLQVDPRPAGPAAQPWVDRLERSLTSYPLRARFRIEWTSPDRSPGSWEDLTILARSEGEVTAGGTDAWRVDTNRSLGPQGPFLPYNTRRSRTTVLRRGQRFLVRNERRLFSALEPAGRAAGTLAEIRAAIESLRRGEAQTSPLPGSSSVDFARLTFDPALPLLFNPFDAMRALARSCGLHVEGEDAGVVRLAGSLPRGAIPSNGDPGETSPTMPVMLEIDEASGRPRRAGIHATETCAWRLVLQDFETLDAQEFARHPLTLEGEPQGEKGDLDGEEEAGFAKLLPRPPLPPANGNAADRPPVESLASDSGPPR